MIPTNYDVCKIGLGESEVSVTFSYLFIINTTLVHLCSVPTTTISFLQTPLSPKTPLPTACLPIS